MDFEQKGIHLPRLCKECGDKLLDKYLCRQCGKRVYRHPNQIFDTVESGRKPFVYCKECGDELLNKYLCQQCGKRIYRNANQVAEMMDSGKRPFVYCKDCGNMTVGGTYYCVDCGRPFHFTLQEEYNIKERSKENPSWTRPKRCFECRKKRQTRGV